MTGVWAAYRNVYDNIQATGDGAKRSKQLFDIGAAIADKDFSLASTLTRELREQTSIANQPSLGWAPSMAADELLYQLSELT